MSSIKDLKKFLKEQAVLIRATKKELKVIQREVGDDCGRFKLLSKLSKDYRHHHIAYCLLRGRVYESIEKPHENNKPDMSYIQEIKDAYTENVCISTQ